MLARRVGCTNYFHRALFVLHIYILLIDRRNLQDPSRPLSADSSLMHACSLLLKEREVKLTIAEWMGWDEYLNEFKEERVDMRWVSSTKLKMTFISMGLCGIFFFDCTETSFLFVCPTSDSSQQVEIAWCRDVPERNRDIPTPPCLKAWCLGVSKGYSGVSFISKHKRNLVHLFIHLAYHYLCACNVRLAYALWFL